MKLRALELCICAHCLSSADGSWGGGRRYLGRSAFASSSRWAPRMNENPSDLLVSSMRRTFSLSPLYKSAQSQDENGGGQGPSASFFFARKPLPVNPPIEATIIDPIIEPDTAGTHAAIADAVSMQEPSTADLKENTNLENATSVQEDSITASAKEENLSIEIPSTITVDSNAGPSPPSDAASPPNQQSKRNKKPKRRKASSKIVAEYQAKIEATEGMASPPVVSPLNASYDHLYMESTPADSAKASKADMPPPQQGPVESDTVATTLTTDVDDPAVDQVLSLLKESLQDDKSSDEVMTLLELLLNEARENMAISSATIPTTSEDTKEPIPTSVAEDLVVADLINIMIEAVDTGALEVDDKTAMEVMEPSPEAPDLAESGEVELGAGDAADIVVEAEFAEHLPNLPEEDIGSGATTLVPVEVGDEALKELTSSVSIGGNPSFEAADELMTINRLLNDVDSPEESNRRKVAMGESMSPDSVYITTLSEAINTPSPETLYKDRSEEDGIDGSSFVVPSEAILKDAESIIKKSPRGRMLEDDEEDNEDVTDELAVLATSSDTQVVQDAVGSTSDSSVTASTWGDVELDRTSIEFMQEASSPYSELEKTEGSLLSQPDEPSATPETSRVPSSPQLSEDSSATDGDSQKVDPLREHEVPVESSLTLESEPNLEQVMAAELEEDTVDSYLAATSFEPEQMANMAFGYVSVAPDRFEEMAEMDLFNVKAAQEGMPVAGNDVPGSPESGLGEESAGFADAVESSLTLESEPNLEQAMAAESEEDTIDPYLAATSFKPEQMANMVFDYVSVAPDRFEEMAEMDQFNVKAVQEGMPVTGNDIPGSPESRLGEESAGFADVENAGQVQSAEVSAEPSIQDDQGSQPQEVSVEIAAPTVQEPIEESAGGAVRGATGPADFWPPQTGYAVRGQTVESPNTSNLSFIQPLQQVIRPSGATRRIAFMNDPLGAVSNTVGGPGGMDQKILGNPSQTDDDLRSGMSRYEATLAKAEALARKSVLQGQERQAVPQSMEYVPEAEPASEGAESELQETALSASGSVNVNQVPSARGNDEEISRVVEEEPMLENRRYDPIPPVFGVLPDQPFGNSRDWGSSW